MLDLGLRLAARSLLVEANGFWLAIDLSKKQAISLEFGRVPTLLESVKQE